jgi:hypothetical protein
MAVYRSQHEPLKVPGRWGADERKFVMQLENLFDRIFYRLSKLGKEAVLAAHPPDSIYISGNNTDPAELFGGTWETLTSPITGTYAWRRTE